MFSSIFNVIFNGFVVPDSAFKTYSCITYYEFFKLSKLLVGAKQYICNPNISLGGGGGATPSPPPPQDRRLWYSTCTFMFDIHWVLIKRNLSLLQKKFNINFHNGVGVVSPWPWLTAQLTSKKKKKKKKTIGGGLQLPPPATPLAPPLRTYSRSINQSLLNSLP